MNIEPGDTVVYVGDTLLGGVQTHATVKAVRGDTIDLGVNGRINRSEVQEVHKGGMRTALDGALG